MSRKNSTQATQAAHNNNNDGEVTYDIISPDKWNIADHNCGQAKANKSGQGKSAQLTYNKRRFYLKVPKMYCPFGASKPKPKPGEQEKETDQWSVQLAFGNDAPCQVFQQKANEFDEFMIDEGAKPDNCVGWLGGSKVKPFSREVVESKYNRMVKYSKDKQTGEPSNQYPPFVRATFPTTFKAPYEFTCEIYDKNNEPVTVSTNAQSPNCINKVVTPGCWCSALLSGSIWCNTTGYGVTWRVAQLKVFPPKGSLPKGKCLVDDPDDDDENDDEEIVEGEGDGKNEEKVDDPDEEIIEEDETAEVVTPSTTTTTTTTSAPTPAPAPTTVQTSAKKIVSKK